MHYCTLKISALGTPLEINMSTISDPPTTAAIMTAEWPNCNEILLYIITNQIL